MIPLVISMASFILSFLLILLTWWAERFKLDFEMTKWFGCNSGGHPIFICLYITNNSKLPCSVLEVKIRNDERKGQIAEGSGTGNKKLLATIEETDRNSKEIYSLDYPVKIEPYNSIGGYFHVFSKFGFCAYEENTIEITIKTSRGIKTKDIFMDRGKNIFRVMQHQNQSADVKIDTRSDGSIIDYIEF